ncbi:ADP-forming succinate--CoA ligase subunit beta [Pantoea sp. Aalb]|uniref:ADP-forming succinate--CoA ligase subunit beta n=1 Tax=Pantoea sp. Aalb TaxID=2576762 RepID=UPI001327E859|nr:ADP-forming succinate--CoA ligase subunit beta [Pantoea sp. Aalb]MXP67532.1 ADP-forming succinate--CoA ligase subunit beta [Pantoea sp. Aalb]
MNLHEYQAKKIFARYGIPVPIGYVCSTPNEAEEAILKIGVGPWVVKCQVHAGGRGKANGIKVINSKEDIRVFAEKWLGNRLVTYQTDRDGKLVNQLLVEKFTYIDQELYISIVIDRSIHRVVLIASPEGGIEIEKAARNNPSLIHKIILDPLMGPQLYQGRELAFEMGLYGKQINQFTNIFMGLVTMFLEHDLEIVEINPLVITKHGDLICLDGKICVDNNSLFRQQELRDMRDLSQEDPREVQAMQWELSYIALEGNIGCMVNGAGLAMATMDIVKHYGGKPANFLDVGGSATKERVIEAFKIILSDHAVKTIFINIFGGIVRCDLIADGIISAISEINIHVPVIVRLEGNNADLGAKKLVSSGMNIIAAKNLIDATQHAIFAAKGNI